MWKSGHAQPRHLSTSDAQKGRLKCPSEGQTASAASRKKKDSWGPLLGTENHGRIGPLPHVLHCQDQVNMMCLYNLACCCCQAISFACGYKVREFVHRCACSLHRFKLTSCPLQGLILVKVSLPGGFALLAVHVLSVRGLSRGAVTWSAGGALWTGHRVGQVTPCDWWQRLRLYAHVENLG